MNLHAFADVTHLLDQLVLAGFVQKRFKFGIKVKVVFDGPFATAGDDQNVFVAGRNRVPIPAAGIAALRTLVC